jgi:hypothetical protein
MKRWQSVLAVALLAALVAGCGAAAAQEQEQTADKARFEHGVLEWIQYRSAKEDKERYSWTTAVEEIQRETAVAFFGALGVGADQKRSAADRVSVLDHLAAAGWELVNRTDVAYTDAGGSAIAERYALRRRR